MGRWGAHVKDIVVCLFFVVSWIKKSKKIRANEKSVCGGVLRHPPKKQGCANVQIVAQTRINTGRIVFHKCANKKCKIKTFALFIKI